MAQSKPITQTETELRKACELAGITFEQYLRMLENKGRLAA